VAYIEWTHNGPMMVEYELSLVSWMAYSKQKAQDKTIFFQIAIETSVQV